MPGSVYDPNLDKDKDNEFNPQIASGGTLIGGQQPQESQSQEKGSGRFQNLQGYLEANKGSGFGENFASKLDTDINSANPMIQDAGKQFASRVNEKTVRLDPGERDKMAANLYLNPQGLAGNQSELEKFKKLRDAEYKGPQALADQQDLYQQAYGAAEKAKSTAGAAQNEGGRFALLNNYFGRPGYSQGEKNLDQLLVTQNDAAKSSIQKSREGAAQAQANFQSQAQNAANLAAGARGETEAARKATRDVLGIDEKGQYKPVDPNSSGAIQKTQLDLQNQLANFKSDRAKQLEETKNRLNQYTPTLQDLRSVGLLGPNQDTSFEFYQTTPLSSYVSPAAGNPEYVTDIASPEQIAKLKALQSLADGGDILNYDARTQGFDPNITGSFDLNKFREDSKSAYRDNLLPAWLYGSDSPTQRAPGYNIPGRPVPESQKPIVTPPNQPIGRTDVDPSIGSTVVTPNEPGSPIQVKGGGLPLSYTDPVNPGGGLNFGTTIGKRRKQ